MDSEPRPAPPFEAVFEVTSATIDPDRLARLAVRMNIDVVLSPARRAVMGVIFVMVLLVSLASRRPLLLAVPLVVLALTALVAALSVRAGAARIRAGLADENTSASRLVLSERGIRQYVGSESTHTPWRSISDAVLVDGHLVLTESSGGRRFLPLFDPTLDPGQLLARVRSSISSSAYL